MVPKQTGSSPNPQTLSIKEEIIRGSKIPKSGPNATTPRPEEKRTIHPGREGINLSPVRRPGRSPEPTACRELPPRKKPAQKLWESPIPKNGWRRGIRFLPPPPSPSSAKRLSPKSLLPGNRRRAEIERDYLRRRRSRETPSGESEKPPPFSKRREKSRSADLLPTRSALPRKTARRAPAPNPAPRPEE